MYILVTEKIQKKFTLLFYYSMIYHISFDFITFWSNKQDSVAFLTEIFKYIAATAIDQIWVTVSLSQT